MMINDLRCMEVLILFLQHKLQLLLNVFNELLCLMFSSLENPLYIVAEIANGGDNVILYLSPMLY